MTSFSSELEKSQKKIFAQNGEGLKNSFMTLDFPTKYLELNIPYKIS